MGHSLSPGPSSKMKRMSGKIAQTAELRISALENVRIGRAMGVILLVSIAAFASLFWLVLLRHPGGQGSRVVGLLPAVNAGLNGLSTVFLVAGFAAVLRGNYGRHMRFMLAAFASSTLFLVSYVLYHNAHGETRFVAQGWVRPVYFGVLISHITLSAVALPLILTSFFLALSGKFPIHRRVSRFTFPIWLYVSVTGVLVFLMLKFCNG